MTKRTRKKRKTQKTVKELQEVKAHLQVDLYFIEDDDIIARIVESIEKIDRKISKLQKRQNLSFNQNWNV